MQANRELATRVRLHLHARACRAVLGPRYALHFLSTDTVFDGERGMYTETDIPALSISTPIPRSRGEIDQEFGGNFVIARVALVMGLPVLGEGNSFVSRMAHGLREGKQVTTPAAEVRTPVDVITLGRLARTRRARIPRHRSPERKRPAEPTRNDGAHREAGGLDERIGCWARPCRDCRARAASARRFVGQYEGQGRPQDANGGTGRRT